MMAITTNSSIRVKPVFLDMIISPFKVPMRVRHPKPFPFHRPVYYKIKRISIMFP